MDSVRDLQRITREAMRARVYEIRLPIPGLRHNDQPIIVRHRFPVKYGLMQAELPMIFGIRRMLRCPSLIA